MSKHGRISVLILVASLMLAGCGKSTLPTDVGQDTLILDKSGAVTYYLTDSFEEDYYSVDELSAMAQEEASASRNVVINNVAMSTIDPSRVVITYGFQELKDYRAFTDIDVAFGTVKELVLDGYSANVSLKSLKDGSAFTQDDITDAADKHMLISKEPMIFYIPYDALCVSEGVIVMSDGGIDATNAVGTVYVLFKR